MARKGQHAPRGRPGHVIDPRPRDFKLLQRLARLWQRAKGRGRGRCVHALHVRRHHAARVVRGHCGKHLAAGMPGHGQHCALVLARLLRHPPVIGGLEKGNERLFGARGHGKFLPIGAPLYVHAGHPVRQNHHLRHPLPALEHPHKGAAVVRARHDLVGDGVPVNGRDNQVVLSQHAAALPGRGVCCMAVRVNPHLCSVGRKGQHCSRLCAA